MPEINPERLLDDLRRLRSFGACGNGVVRTSFTDVDMESRRWLVGRMTEAGLEAQIDGVGNVIGRSPNGGKALVMGSHTDTQPRGGWLDGAMGVIYALEIARALTESDGTTDLPLDIASWMDEEGMYLDCLGSMSFTEQLSDDAIRRGANEAGQTVGAAIRAAGLEGLPAARLEHDRHVGYLEAHIEQGPALEAEGKRIGVVTAIVGARTFRLTFRGEQNHAGTTPMPLRRDAGDGLIDFAYRVRERLRALAGERTVFTIGQVVFDPGVVSIIPGLAEMSLQFRDPEESRLDALENAVREFVAESDRTGPVEIKITATQSSVLSAAMDETLLEHIARAAETHAPGDWIHMPSGACHDAQILALRIPAAMLFVPSIGGISHDFAEDTAEEDVVLGCQVLATATASILRELNPR